MNDKTRHIVHITPGFSFGGAERTIVDCINNSDPARFRFSVIVLSSETALASEIRRSDCRVVTLSKKGFGFHLKRDIARTLRELKADLVHTHVFGADMWGRLAAKSVGIPSVTTEHNVDEVPGEWRKLIKRFWPARARHYVACSDRVKRYVLGRYHYTEPLTVIRPGIETNRFAGLEPPLWQEPWQLIMIGRLTEQKNHALAFQALCKLQDKAWHLTVLGEGELEAELKALAGQLGLRERITFLPPTHDVPGALERAHLLLMPSKWEGIGIVIMEAMAAGRVVLASQVDGIPELVTDEENGFLFTPITEEALARRLEHVFDQSSRLANVAEAARHFALERCSAERMAAEYAAVYDSVS